MDIERGLYMFVRMVNEYWVLAAMAVIAAIGMLSRIFLGGIYRSLLKDLKRDHTILMITHKPALMKMADEILVIDHGRLVGKGTHKELMEDNKYYQILQK